MGNPGSRYNSTRHNVGFEVLRALALEFGVEPEFEKWKERGGSRFLKFAVGGRDLLLVAPQMYMNRSGRALSALLGFYRIALADLLVIHDDLDLPPGRLKLKSGSSAGGHRGVADLISLLASRDFLRLRVGVGHPRDYSDAGGFDVSSWVLAPPLAPERELLRTAVERAVGTVGLLLSDGLAAAAQFCNRVS